MEVLHTPFTASSAPDAEEGESSIWLTGRDTALKIGHGFLHVTFSTQASLKSFTDATLTNRRSSPSLPLRHPTGDHLFAYGRLPTTPVRLAPKQDPALVCLASYCETHLEPHLTASRLKRHQLVEPVENLEGRMCTKHDKLLELFCKTDQMCVCMLCTVSDHKTHDVVPLKEEYEGKKAELGKTEAEIQQMIQKRRLKIEEIKQSGGAQ
ncbi:hypothetical protein L3Q82_007103 [Scortum barcoo]|uniref:Uncharacterized protein n=1 Tax=Scortum barcoo TaxID=214431 RepID=A0ACB8WSI0_9TELE|nr:hypothetical protein L3Q82_007103 [Scortum barcoo]